MSINLYVHALHKKASNQAMLTLTKRYSVYVASYAHRVLALHLLLFFTIFWVPHAPEIAPQGKLHCEIPHPHTTLVNLSS